MAPKRKLEDSEPQATVHESRQAQIYGKNPKPAKKPRNFESSAPTQVHASSVNAIKKRIRDVTRRLERSDALPANVRIEDERALAGYEQELAVAEAEKTRQKMIKRYHKVRFFERKKADRSIKKLRKQLLEATTTEEVQQLKHQMHVAEVDLNYTRYCPLSEIYISLYPPKDEDGEDEDSRQESVQTKPPLWVEVERHMEEGTLNQLRNRLPPPPVKKIVRRPKSKPTKHTKHVKLAISRPQPTTIDLTGLNRRQRRSQAGITQKTKTKTKHKSIGFEKNQAFGATEGAKTDKTYEKDDNGSEDGGFFEE
ncbi:hypothetical protein B0O99DRAFT_661603 [Bisporella sp. PMI_857]|nr:hypothetical protein B0O99DRAFT_661603 [Bisporella sp. PMI_857]